jgi:hypothetical protein
MVLSIKDELRRAFELASLRREAGAIRAPGQWAQITKLTSRCLDARIKEKDLYEARYATRVEVRRRELIDKAGRKDVHHTPRGIIGTDKFDPQATLRQAQRDVRSAHAQRLARIDEHERVQLKAHVERFTRESQASDAARREFNRVSGQTSQDQPKRDRSRDH